MMFTIFDISIFTIIAVSTAFGVYRGMVNITISLIGFISSIILAIYLFPLIHHFLLGHVENHALVAIISGAFAYIFALVVTTLITAKAIALCSFMSCGGVDRALGLIFGLIRGLVVSIFVFALVAIISSGSYIKAENLNQIISNLNRDKYPEYLIKSKTTKFLELSLKKSITFIPQNIMEYNILPKPPEIDKKIKDNIDIIEEIKEKKKEMEGE